MNEHEVITVLDYCLYTIVLLALLSTIATVIGFANSANAAYSSEQMAMQSASELARLSKYNNTTVSGADIRVCVAMYADDNFKITYTDEKGSTDSTKDPGDASTIVVGDNATYIATLEWDSSKSNVEGVIFREESD